MPVDEQQVRHVARLAHLALPTEEIAVLTSELEAILGYVDRLGTAQIGGEPTLGGTQRLRPDVAVSCNPAPILASAPAREGDLIAVPLASADPKR